MDQTEPNFTPPDFRVLTRIYPHGRPEKIASVVPLHPKVKAYLSQRADILRFEIYDGVRGPFCLYQPDEIFARKIYFVRTSAIHNPTMGSGPSTVMIFDQMTGEMLYHGSDGGE